MKIKKNLKAYCKKCKKTVEHTATMEKQGGRNKTHPMSRGAIARARRRGLGRGFGNLGRYGSKPAISKFKMTGAKNSKKTNLLLKCKECSKSQIMTLPRAKKVELI